MNILPNRLLILNNFYPRNKFSNLYFVIFQSKKKQAISQVLQIMKKYTHLKCPQFNDSYIEPRILPCGQSICNYCIETIENPIQFRCVLCKVIHQIPALGFPFDLELIKLNKSQQSTALPKEANQFQTCLNEFEKKLKQAEFELENGDFLINEHTKELKRQVQLAKEIKVQKLSQHSANMQFRLDKHHKDFMNSYIPLTNEEFISQLNRALLSEMKPGPKAVQLKEFLKHFSQNFNLTKCERKNSHDLKSEYCSELKAKIEMQAENKIQLLDNHAEEMMLDIDENARRLTDQLMWSNKCIQNQKLYDIKEKLKVCHTESNSYVGKRFLLNYLHSKLATEKENQKSLFFNDQIIELIRTVGVPTDTIDMNNEPIENLLGIKLMISDTNRIDFNQSNAISLTPLISAIQSSVDFFEVNQATLVDLVPVCLDNGDSVVYICFKAVANVYRSTCQSVFFNLYCVLINQEQSIKKIKLLNVVTSKILKDRDVYNKQSEDFYQFIRLESCSNKILLNFCDDNKKHLYILDHNLEFLKQIETNDKELAGCNEAFVFMATRDKKLSPLYVYDWSLQLVSQIGQRTLPNEPFYFPFTLKQVKARNGKYYIIELERENYLHIIDEQSGRCETMSPIKNNGFVLFFHIDTDNRLVLIENLNNLIFMSPFGHNLKEIQIENRPMCGDYSIDCHNTLYLCSKETKQLLIKKTNNCI